MFAKKLEITFKHITKVESLDEFIYEFTIKFVL